MRSLAFFDLRPSMTQVNIFIGAYTWHNSCIIVRTSLRMLSFGSPTYRHQSALPYYYIFCHQQVQHPLVTSMLTNYQLQIHLCSQQVNSTLLMRYGMKLTASSSCRWYPSAAAIVSSTRRYSSCFMSTVVLVSKKRRVCHLRMRSMLLRLASLSTSHICQSHTKHTSTSFTMYTYQQTDRRMDGRMNRQTDMTTAFLPHVQYVVTSACWVRQIKRYSTVRQFGILKFAHFF